VGIGHVRYPTAGSASAQEAQPFFVNSPLGVYLIHNGNLTNVDELREALEGSQSFFSRHLRTDSDSEARARRGRRPPLRCEAACVQTCCAGCVGRMGSHPPGTGVGVSWTAETSARRARCCARRAAAPASAAPPAGVPSACPAAQTGAPAAPAPISRAVHVSFRAAH